MKRKPSSRGCVAITDLPERSCGTVNPQAAHLLQLASAAEAAGRAEAAIEAYREAIRLAPGSPAAYVNLAALLGSLARFEEALPACQRAVELAPRSVAAQLNLASTLAELRRLDEAVACFAQALRLAPDDAALWNDLADCLVLAGRVTEALPLLRQMSARNPRDLAARRSLLFALNFVCESQAELSAEHQRFNAVIEPSQGARRIVGSKLGRIRLGLVSGDLHRHSVAYFLAPILDRYDRARFHVTCYSTGRVVDPVTAWLRGRADVWRGAHGSTDEELAQQIRADEIDILMDLGGHTSSGRLLVFARRAAPVQVSFLGYPTTTGLTCMGYRISDRRVDPPEAPAAGPEHVIRMPHSYFCYRPPAEAPAPSRPPCLRTGHVTFGSFNTLAKISDRVLTLWAAVLTAVPDARLLIKAQGLGIPAARQRMLTRCAAASIDTRRVDMMEWQKDVQSHLSCYAQVDIALDTFPYNGATTTCEALWMGVPVVSLAGETHASRMGLSILNSAGRGEWVVDDPGRFVAMCTALAGNPRGLAAERADSRKTLAASPLMDELAYVRAFEELLEACVPAAGTENAAGRSPRS